MKNKIFKKIIALTAAAALLLGCNAYSAVLDGYPKIINSNTTAETPHLTRWHMQTARQRELGLRGGESGQVITAMAVSPVNERYLILGTDMNGLWTSNDGGESWTQVYNTKAVHIAALKYSPVNLNEVYMMYGDDSGLNSQFEGVWRSTDGGQTWSHVLFANIVRSNITVELLNFDDKGILYALTNNGLYRSADGEEWTELTAYRDALSNEANEAVYNIYAGADGLLAASTRDNGLIVSVDGGKSFTAKNPFEDISSQCFSVNPKNPDIWYADFYNFNTYMENETEQAVGGRRGIYQSNDFGATWTRLSSLKTNSHNVPSGIYWVPKPDGEYNLLLTHNTKGNGGSISTDYGTTWDSVVYDAEKISLFNVTAYFASPMVVTSEGVVHMGDTNAVMRSADYGISFERFGGGLSGAVIENVTQASDGTLYFSMVDKGLLRTNAPFSSNDYPTVERISPAMSVGDTALNPDDESEIIIADGSNHYLRRYNRDADTWDEIEGTAGDANFVRYHTTNTDIIYSTHYISRDGGDSWIPNAITSYYEANGNDWTLKQLAEGTSMPIRITDMSDINPDVIVGYARINDGTRNSSNIYYSTDAGITWYEIKVSGGNEAMKVICDVADTDVFYAAYKSGRIVTADYNTSATLFSCGQRVYYIQQNPYNKDHLMFGTNPYTNQTALCESDGLYESLDGGASWHLVDGFAGTRRMYNVFFLNEEEALVTTMSGSYIYDYARYNNLIEESSNNLTFYSADEITPDREALMAADNTIVNNTTVGDGSISYQTPGGRGRYLFYRINVDDIDTDYLSGLSMSFNLPRVHTKNFEIYGVNSGLDWSTSRDLTNADVADFNADSCTELLGTFIIDGVYATKTNVGKVTMPLNDAAVEFIKTKKAAGDKYVTFALHYLYFKYANEEKTEVALDSNLRISSIGGSDSELYPKLLAEYPVFDQVSSADRFVAKAKNLEVKGAAYVRPIIAVYNASGNQLLNIHIGEATAVTDGIAKYPVASIKGFNSGNIIKAFLWSCDSAKTIDVTPVADSLEISVK